MIIDLSVALDDDTPAYPGDPTIELTQDSSVTTDGYLGHTIRLGSHTGTHIDAPAHMIEGAATLGSFDLTTFIGNGKLVCELSVAAIIAADVTSDDIVLFYTGASQRLYEPSYFTDYPTLPPEVVDYLIYMKVKLIGLDTCSADSAAGFPIHNKLLGAGIPIIENLTNLLALQELATIGFMVYALPMKLDIDGAPARVIAMANRFNNPASHSQASESHHV